MAPHLVFSDAIYQVGSEREDGSLALFADVDPDGSKLFSGVWLK
jgi:hypothetical protein